MKVKKYHASSDAGEKRQYLDRWQTFSSLTDVTYTTQGQHVLQQVDWLDTGGTVAIAITGVATVAVSGSITALNQYDLLAVNGAIYSLGSASVASGLGVAAINALTPTLQPAPAVAVTATTVVKKLVRQGMQVVTQQCAKTVNNLTIKAHGINIYDNFPAGFFNAYTSYHYGGVNINTPEDCGAMFVPFCLYPGTYQPSGHINVSRAREFYLTYDSSVISGSNEGTLVVIASAINFLLISDGSACYVTVIYSVAIRSSICKNIC